MKKLNYLLIIILITVSFLSCSKKEVFYTADDFLEPYSAGQVVDIPSKPAEVIIEVNYKPMPEWAKELSGMVPVYDNATFLEEKKPVMEDVPLEKGKIKISATVFHKDSSELIYSWIADNLEHYGLSINRSLPNNEDPLIFIPADGSGSIQTTDGYYSIKIELTPIKTEPGWVMVTYNGYRFIASE